MRLVWLAAPLLLGVSRLVPAHGAGLALRLAAAVACLLLPGALVARALGVRGLSAAFAWTMAALFGATALMFAVHSSLWLALGVLIVVAVAALPFVGRRSAGVSAWGLGVLALGAVAGISLWWVSGYDGDAFFHLAREQKLLSFDSLSLRSVDEFRDGGLHPGYAFPLWHAAIALIARLAAVGLVGFLIARAVLDVRHDLVHIGAALGAILAPAGLVVVWLLPVVRETASHDPAHSEVRRAFANYGQELDVFGLHSYRLTPEFFGRAGAIAVASLALLPLAI